jgi:microcystin degradation protein MlrC
LNDLAFFELHGIDVTKLGLLGVKAKNHFRGSFTHLIPHFVEIDTPGPAGVDLRALPFKHADLAQLDHDAPMRGAAGD